MSLVITHPGGTREIEAYRVRPSDRGFARAFDPSPERYSAGGVVARGDGREVPSPLVVTASILGESLLDTYTLAYQVLAEAEVATQVTTYRGSRGVQGLLRARMDVEQTDIELTLEFAPTGPWAVST